MKEIALQYKDKLFHPFSKEDQEKASEFKDNQIVTGKLRGAKKPRSLIQLRLYWAVCQNVANNTEAPGWKIKEQVDFQVRVALHFYDPGLIIAKPDGSIAVSYRSIAFKNLGHCEACNFFDRAFEIMARHLKCSVDELLKNTNS